MKYTYVCTQDDEHILVYCADHVGESAVFYSEWHEATMVGTVIWVEHRTVTVEVVAHV